MRDLHLPEQPGPDQTPASGQSPKLPRVYNALGCGYGMLVIGWLILVAFTSGHYLSWISVVVVIIFIFIDTFLSPGFLIDSFLKIQGTPGAYEIQALLKRANQERDQTQEQLKKTNRERDQIQVQVDNVNQERERLLDQKNVDERTRKN
jgi:hypothetical protein